jgi:hypothetical protein
MSEDKALEDNRSIPIATSVSFNAPSDMVVEPQQEKSVLASQEFRFLLFGSMAVVCLALWLLVKLGRTDSHFLMLDFRKWRPVSTRLDETAARVFYESIQGAAPELRAFRIVLQLPPNAIAGEGFGSVKRFQNYELARSLSFLIRKVQKAPADTSSASTHEVHVLVNGVRQASYQLSSLERGELIQVELPPGEPEVAIEIVAPPFGDVAPGSADFLYIEFGEIEDVRQ